MSLPNDSPALVKAPDHQKLLEKHRERILEILKKYGLGNPRLFGSVQEVTVFTERHPAPALVKSANSRNLAHADFCVRIPRSERSRRTVSGNRRPCSRFAWASAEHLRFGSVDRRIEIGSGACLIDQHRISDLFRDRCISAASSSGESSATGFDDR